MMSSSRITSSSSPSTLTVWPGILAEQDLVADLDVERAHLAVFEDLALADGHDFALVGLLGGGVGNDDAGSGLALFFQPLDDHAVVQGTNFQCHECSPWGLLALTRMEC